MGLVHLAVDKFADESFLRRSDASFRAKTASLVTGCVGAIDGMAVRITKPAKRDTPSPKHFYCLRR